MAIMYQAQREPVEQKYFRAFRRNLKKMKLMVYMGRRNILRGD